tara:strand:+ start:240 stop:494 length:255 start_codon:yes stop_codon:yes gene_type:complete
MSKNKDNLDKIIQKLQDDEENINFKNWNENLVSKFILVFPTLFFLFTFLRINNDKSITDLFNFLIVSSLLVLFGVILNFLLTKK